MSAAYRFHHTGVVTSDLEASRRAFEALGYAASERFTDEAQKSYIVLMSAPPAVAGSPLIELVCPMNDASPAAGWVKRIRAGAYHVCFEVVDLGAACEQLRASGYSAVSKPAPSPAFGGREVVFLWSPAAGLIELLERAKN